MRRSSFALVAVVSGSLVALSAMSSPVRAQGTRPPNSSLLELKRAVERGTAEDDRRITDYAVAHPNDPEALELLARLRLRQGRISEAKALCQRVLKLDSRSVSAKVMSARIALLEGQTAEAIAALDNVGDATSSEPALRYELANVLMLTGETERALSIAEALPANLKNSVALPLLGAIHSSSGHVDRLTALVPTMKRAVIVDPPLAVACAGVLRDASRLDDAIAVLTSVRNYQADVSVLVALARLQIAKRDFAGARENVKRAASLEPDSVDVISVEALLEAANGDPDEAFKLLSRARTSAPSSPAVLYDFAVVAMRNNKPAEAIDAAKTLVALDPMKPEFRYLYGAASLQGGDLDTAESILEAYVKERPSDSRGCLALGMTYAGRRDQIQKAREQLRHCFTIDPANTEAKYQLALSFRSQGENGSAVPLLEEVVRQDPANAPALRDLGALYFEIGDAAKSRPLLEKAVELNPKDADTHFQLARLYSQLGETELAKKHQEIFRQLRGPWGKPSR